MIIVLLTYKVPLERIDELRAAHIDWLKQGLDAGLLLAAGRKAPATGGMLLVRGDLDAAKAWCATDPFWTEGAADYDFTEVAPTITAPGLEALKG